MGATKESFKSISGEVQEEEVMTQVALMVNAIAFPMTMKVAIELGLLDIIASVGPLTVAEVVERLPAKKNPQTVEMVERILRLLVAFSVVSCSDEVVGAETRRVYGIMLAGMCFVKSEEGVSLAPLLLLLTDKVKLQSWERLKDAVLEGGISFNKAHNVSLYDYKALDSRFNDVFDSAMLNHTTIQMNEVLESYQGFARINKLVDVGGNLGQNLKLILPKYPDMKGINFDLPSVIEHAVSHPGIEHMGGDMFESIPNADAILMKWILHNWDDESCVKVLKNCHKAIPTNGKVIVIDAIVSEVPDTTEAAKIESGMDLTMMISTTRGRERTKKEFLALARAAGFSGIRFECNVLNLWVMEFHK